MGIGKKTGIPSPFGRKPNRNGPGSKAKGPGEKRRRKKWLRLKMAGLKEHREIGWEGKRKKRARVWRKPRKRRGDKGGQRTC